MIDLFSLKGKRKDLVVSYFKKKMYKLIDEDGSLTVVINKWYKTMTISCIILHGIVVLIIVKARIAPFYEKYTVL
ncbi:hypothetical protein [Chryseobacterium pennipullorum]|uniref:Uncharacterized protein n=1 Tax=Chryseobacterium pennipullorum TaxID=2258963 RepID=A0A3D9B0N7_9FLAO|nr:hypothetical protein [Chryseobacterium pennipullorum]REC47195.1 hypothetical protein DRF67_11250 [Chryseobacterium pennipullorum]